MYKLQLVYRFNHPPPCPISLAKPTFDCKIHSKTNCDWYNEILQKNWISFRGVPIFAFGLRKSCSSLSMPGICPTKCTSQQFGHDLYLPLFVDRFQNLYTCNPLAQRDQLIFHTLTNNHLDSIFGNEILLWGKVCSSKMTIIVKNYVNRFYTSENILRVQQERKCFILFSTV